MATSNDYIESIQQALAKISTLMPGESTELGQALNAGLAKLDSEVDDWLTTLEDFECIPSEGSHKPSSQI